MRNKAGAGKVLEATEYREKGVGNRRRGRWEGAKHRNLGSLRI